MTAHRSVQPVQFRPRASTAKRMDHQRQHNLIQPRIQRLHHQLVGHVITHRHGPIDKPFAKCNGAGAKEPARVKIQIALPIIIRLRRIQTALKVQIELVIKRFPNGGIAGPIKLFLRPCPFAFHRCGRARKIKRHIHQLTGDQRIGIKEHKRLAFRHHRKPFDLVAIRVIFAKVMVLKASDLRPHRRELRAHRLRDPRVAAPPVARLRLHNDHLAAKLGRHLSQRRHKQQRLIFQPACLADNHDIKLRHMSCSAAWSLGCYMSDQTSMTASGPRCSKTGALLPHNHISQGRYHGSP